MSWSAYYDLDEIYAWMDELKAAYPDKISIVDGGESYEGRKIKGAILATNAVSSVDVFSSHRYGQPYASMLLRRTTPECSWRVECTPASGSEWPPPPSS